jgi:ribose 5-phosphate isomerase RpiB
LRAFSFLFTGNSPAPGPAGERAPTLGVENHEIALINENSQAAKNGLIHAALTKVAEPMGHTVDNYGMYGADDPRVLTYVQNGILASTLLTAGAADYVVTGCGTGEGAMLACNSFPNVLCGHVANPSDAFLFAQVNDGNCVAIPFAQGFGWGGELNLEYIFEKLFGCGSGNGYPPERREPEQRNKKILDAVRAHTIKALPECLAGLDPALVRGAVAGERFAELFFPRCKNPELANYIRSIR